MLQKEQTVQTTTGGKIKAELAQLFKIGKRELAWIAIMQAMYQLVNYIFYGKERPIYQYLLTVIFSYVSTMTVLANSQILTIVLLLISTPTLINYPLPLFCHFMLHMLLNIQEGENYSTLIMLCAESACITFSRKADRWPFVLTFSLLAILTQIKSFESSKLGAQVILYAHSIILDIVISMPKNKVKNIIINSFTAVAIMIYQQKFLRTAVGSTQAGIVTASLLIRLVVNTLNAFLIVPGTSDV